MFLEPKDELVWLAWYRVLWSKHTQLLLDGAFLEDADLDHLSDGGIAAAASNVRQGTWRQLDRADETVALETSMSVQVSKSSVVLPQDAYTTSRHAGQELSGCLCLCCLLCGSGRITANSCCINGCLTLRESWRNKCSLRHCRYSERALNE